MLKAASDVSTTTLQASCVKTVILPAVTVKVKSFLTVEFTEQAKLGMLLHLPAC